MTGVGHSTRVHHVWRDHLASWAAAVYEFVRKQNIERLKKQIAAERDPEKRRVLEALLADHEAGDPIRHRDPAREGDD